MALVNGINPSKPGIAVHFLSKPTKKDTYDCMLGFMWPWVRIQIVPSVNIRFNPHRLKWVVNSPSPKWDPIGFDNHSHVSRTGL